MGKHPEKILVVPSAVAALTLREGFNDGLDEFSELLRMASFAVRDDVEEDPAWRQVIPYVVFRAAAATRGDDPDVFTYRRAAKGGESRLHGLLSLGVGGHMEETDFPDTVRTVSFMSALHRELSEEVCASHGGYLSITRLVPAGLIHDTSTAVGRVHLGVCYAAYVNDRIKAMEDHLADDQWMTWTQALSQIDSFELWSQLVLRSLVFGGA